MQEININPMHINHQMLVENGFAYIHIYNFLVQVALTKDLSSHGGNARDS